LSIVVDMSVVLAWLFDEQQTPQSLDVLRSVEIEGLLVPPLWWTELENGILSGERRGRVNAEHSAAFVQLVRALPIETDDAPRHRVIDHVLDLGRTHQLTAYDATYIELAQRAHATLCTFDEDMRRCAAALRIELLPALI
jgi:predicted nucleic acid-binding protein